MKLTFLGTGTSGGVPALGCQCEVCRSKDSRDKRFRSVALLETTTTRVLIDCGPDIRMQLMQQPFKQIDAVLVTHIHYDHVAGIDDLRPYCKFGDIAIYANAGTVQGLKRTMPYCFTDNLYPGVPRLNLHAIAPHREFTVGDIHVMPFTVMHDQLPILAFRFGKLAYITDMKTIDASELPFLYGVETLVVNALRWERPHHSHMLVDDAIAFARQIGAKHTYFTHMTHQMGLHEQASKMLPAGFQMAYDGLQIKI